MCICCEKFPTWVVINKLNQPAEASHSALKKLKQMGLIIIITLLSISFSALLPPCTSLNLQLQPSLHHQGPGAINAQQKLSLPVLPRKLRFTEKVQEYDEVRYQLASHKQKNTLPAGKQNMVVGSKGTKEEWSEGGDDPSKYFTMDYPKVNRRRPIHNKNLPVGP